MNSYDDNGNHIYKEFGGTKEFYLRDHSGQELAVFKITGNSDTLQFYNLYGLGLEGRAEQTYTWNYETEPPQIERSEEPYYYIKDHLGTIRVTINKQGTVVYAADYWPYGEKMAEYVSGGTTGQRYVFTEKERDTETGYDYFGARYYDSDLGRWLTVDPLMDKYPGWSPYNYVMGNPLNSFDPDGMRVDVYLKGASNDEVFNALKGKSNLDLQMDIHTGKLSIGTFGYIADDFDLMLYKLISDSKNHVYLNETDDEIVKSIISPEEKYVFGAGAMDGNSTQNGVTTAHQFISIFRSEMVENVGGGDLGDTAFHELLEAYVGALLKSGRYSDETFFQAHNASLEIYPLPKIFEWFEQGRLVKITGPKGEVEYSKYKERRGK